jgi:hypothetical protein
MQFRFKIISVLGLLFLIALNSSCKADTPRKVLNNRNRGGNSEKDTTLCFTIGGYQVCPESRLVKFGHMVGGVNWDGWAYSPDETIDYDTTTLIFLGSYIDFIEHFKGIDFTSLKVLSNKYFQDNKGIYMLGHRKPNRIISLEGKTQISECLFQDEKGIYTLNATSDYPKLNLIEDLDFAIDTLNIQYIVDDFFVDKNGLYSFALYQNSDGGIITYKRGKKLESFDGVVIPKFEVHDSYIVVNGIVYARNGGFTKLELDAVQAKEFLISKNYQTYLISDGNKAYRFSKHYQGPDFAEVEDMKAMQPSVMIGWVEGLYFNEYTQALYIGGYEDVRKGLTRVWNNTGLLFIADDGSCFVLNSDLKVTKYSDLYVYNALMKEFELGNSGNFCTLGKYIYAYKDLLYTYHGSASNSVAHIREKFDTKKVRQFERNGILSNFIEDGKFLLYSGEVTSFHGGLEYGVVKKDYITDQVDFSTLEVINPYILMDKDNIYTMGSKLNVIPKNKLGIKIKVYK